MLFLVNLLQGFLCVLSIVSSVLVICYTLGHSKIGFLEGIWVVGIKSPKYSNDHPA